MAEVRPIEPPGFFGKLLGKTLDAFGVSNDWQEGSTTPMGPCGSQLCELYFAVPTVAPAGRQS